MYRVPESTEYQSLQNTRVYRVPECTEYQSLQSTRVYWVPECTKYQSVLSNRMFRVPECTEYQSVQSTRVPDWKVYQSVQSTRVPDWKVYQSVTVDSFDCTQEYLMKNPIPEYQIWRKCTCKWKYCGKNYKQGKIRTVNSQSQSVKSLSKRWSNWS